MLKLPLNRAEDVKKEVSVFAAPEDPEETVEFSYNARSYTVSKADLHDIVRCRLEELFDTLVRPEIQSAGVQMLPAGIVITGGVSRTEGIDAFVLDLLDLPARVAVPLDADRMPPGRNTQEYSSAAGIIRYILDQERDEFRYIDNPLIMNNSSRSEQVQAKQPGGGLNLPGLKDFKSSGANPFGAIKDLFKDLF